MTSIGIPKNAGWNEIVNDTQRINDTWYKALNTNQTNTWNETITFSSFVSDENVYLFILRSTIGWIRSWDIEIKILSYTRTPVVVWNIHKPAINRVVVSILRRCHYFEDFTTPTYFYVLNYCEGLCSSEQMAYEKNNIHERYDFTRNLFKTETHFYKLISRV